MSDRSCHKRASGARKSDLGRVSIETAVCFHCAFLVSLTRKLAHTLDSLVRVSRRASQAGSVIYSCHASRKGYARGCIVRSHALSDRYTTQHNAARTPASPVTETDGSSTWSLATTPRSCSSLPPTVCNTLAAAEATTRATFPQAWFEEAKSQAVFCSWRVHHACACSKGLSLTNPYIHAHTTDLQKQTKRPTCLLPF